MTASSEGTRPAYLFTQKCIGYCVCLVENSAKCIGNCVCLVENNAKPRPVNFSPLIVPSPQKCQAKHTPSPFPGLKSTSAAVKVERLKAGPEAEAGTATFCCMQQWELLLHAATGIEVTSASFSHAPNGIMLQVLQVIASNRDGASSVQQLAICNRFCNCYLMLQ